MANQKRFVIGYITNSDTPHLCVQRDADGFFLNSSGAFVSSGSPILNAMSEKYEGFWEYETSAEVWDAGTINVTIYAGTVDTQPVIIGYSMLVSGDQVIGYVESAVTTSKNTVNALRENLGTMDKTLTGMLTQIGILSDRIDSLNAILSRRDYNGSTTE